MITTTAAIRTASMQRLLHRYAKSSSAGNIQRRGTTFQRVANRKRIEPPSAPKKKQHRSNLVLLNHPSHVVPSELFGTDDLPSKFDVYDCAICFLIHFISHLSRSFHLFSTVGVPTFTTIKPPTGTVLASILEERSVTFGANTIHFIPSLRTFEDAPDPIFTPSFHAPQRHSLKKSFDFKKCRQLRRDEMKKLQKNERTELVQKRRQARSDFDDDSTIVSDSTEELNEWFPPITLPAIVQDDVAMEEEDEVDESEFPFIGTIIEVPSEERSDSTLSAIVQEDAGVEAAAPQDDVVFDTAGNESFDIEVDGEKDQVTTVSDDEHASIVLFLAAFTTADVPVEEDEAPAPLAIETPSTMPVIHEDVTVEAPAEVAVDEPLVLESIISEQSNNAASRAMKELESTLDGHYWAISEGRSRRRRTQTSFFSPC